MIPIAYVFMNTDKFDWNEKEVSGWLNAVIEKEGYVTKDLSYVFCNDESLLKINIRHLNHDTLTDILTFDLRENSQEKIIDAEIYISVDRVKDNAADFNTDLEEELARVMVHGILHLCGYDDHTEEETAQMRSKENESVKNHPIK